MKVKNSYFVHHDGRNEYDVLIKEDGSAWVLKEEYFEFNGEIKPQNKIGLANSKNIKTFLMKLKKNV